MLNSRTNKHHKSKKIRKHSKDKSLKSLHGALLNLLNKEKSPEEYSLYNKRFHPSNKAEPQPKIDQPNDIIYIRSKENVLIPKLTDDEVMERHKIADENMKNVWTNIIAKYENADDSKGDLIDLNTGEIIEDNGHVRELSTMKPSSFAATSYKSTFTDRLLDEDMDDTTTKNTNYNDNPKNLDNEKLTDSDKDEGNSLWAETESDNIFQNPSSSEEEEEEEEDEDEDDDDDDDEIEQNDENSVNEDF